MVGLREVSEVVSELAFPGVLMEGSVWVVHGGFKI